MWGWVCLRSMLETHPGWITPVKEASPIPHRQGVLIFVAWDGSTPSPGAFPSPCKRGGATASSPMSFQMSGPLSVTLRLYINDGMQSLCLVVGFMFQLWAAAWFSNQTSTFQPKQAGHIWFMQTLCKWESSSLLWNPHSSVRSGCSDNKLNVVTTTQTHPHASGGVVTLCGSLCSFYGLTSSPRTTAAVAAQSDAVRAKVVLLSWLQVVYLLCETWKQTKCANKSPEITRTGTECRVGCEHANSGSFFLFDTVHMKVSGWKHLSAFVCVGGVASPC